MSQPESVPQGRESFRIASFDGGGVHAASYIPILCDLEEHLNATIAVSGQLRMLLRAKYMVDAQGLNKSSGRPFSVAEILERIRLEVARAVQET